MIFRSIIGWIIGASMLMFSACGGGNKKLPDVSDIDAQVTLLRFDTVLANAHPADIHRLIPEWRVKYSYILNNPISDSLLAESIIQFVETPLTTEALRKVKDVFNETSGLEDEISQSFKYFKYYFPEIDVPTVYTYVSGYDARFPIKYSDTALAIGVDMYLGRSFFAYSSLGIPTYQSRWMEKSAIVRDVMAEIYLARFFNVKADKTLLDHMVEQGKQLALISSVLPDIKDTLVLKYSKSQLDWCNDNEFMVWSFFIEQDLLFSMDQQKIGRFVQPGPFTQGFDNESPGNLSAYCGYKMILSYLKNHPENTIADLIRMTDSNSILQESGYRPRR